jgi:hypothetical protein
MADTVPILKLVYLLDSMRAGIRPNYRINFVLYEIPEEYVSVFEHYCLRHVFKNLMKHKWYRE